MLPVNLEPMRLESCILSSPPPSVKSAEPAAPDLLAAAVWMLPLAALLVTWLILGRLLAEPTVLSIWVLLSLVTAAGGFHRLRIRRRAWLRAYVSATSPLQRWLRGGALSMLLALLQAGLLTAGFMLTSLQLDISAGRVALLLAMPLLLLAFALAHWLLRRHLHGGYLPEAAARIGLLFSWLLVTAALALAALFQHGPDFTDVSILDAIRYQAAQAEARSPTLELGLEYAGSLLGLRLWLAQQVSLNLQAGWLAVAAWLLIAAESGFTAWVWLRCCLAVLLLRSLPRRGQRGKGKK